MRSTKKFCKVLYCAEHLLILSSEVTGCISIAASAVLVGMSVGFPDFVAGIKICAIIAIFQK